MMYWYFSGRVHVAAAGPRPACLGPGPLVELAALDDPPLAQQLREIALLCSSRHYVMRRRP